MICRGANRAPVRVPLPGRSQRESNPANALLAFLNPSPCRHESRECQVRAPPSFGQGSSDVPELLCGAPLAAITLPRLPECQYGDRAYAALKERTRILSTRPRACHRSYAVCMPSQASGLEPKAFESRIAISIEIPDLSFTSSDSACRVTPSALAASVTERPSGSRHCRRTIPPG